MPYVRTLLPSVILLSLFWVSSAWTASAPDSGSLLRQQQPPAASLPDRLPAPEEMAETAVTSSEQDFKSLVTGFRYSGIDGAVTEAELNALVHDVLGQELGFSDLKAVTNRITNYLREKGYFLARAYLPKQEIVDGMVEIAVMTGRVDGGAEIRIDGPSRIEFDLLQQMANAAAQDGQPLQSRQLERSLLLMNDLPGVAAKGTLERGETYGSTRVLIDAVEGPLFSGGGSADNFGNRYTGRLRGSVFVSANDPFGIGDQLNLSVTYAERLKSGQLGYSALLMPNGLRAGLAFSALDYELGKEVKSLDVDGTAYTATANLGYPLYRSRDFSLWGDLGYTHRWLKDRANGAVSRDRGIDAGTLGLRSSSYDRFGGGGLTSLSLILTVGDVAIDAVADAAADAATAQTAGRYTKLNYSLSRLQRLSDNLSLFGAFNGQLAADNLDSSEKIILGGPTGIRAYPVNEAAGDEGHLLTAELRYELPRWLTFGDLQLIGFYDAGRVKLHKNLWTNAVTSATGDNAYWLSGAGLGLNLSKSGRYALRSSWAHSIGDNPGRSTTGMNADNKDDEQQFWLQAIIWF